MAYHQNQRPAPVPQPPAAPKAPESPRWGATKRVVVERYGNNQYRVLELVYAGPPTEVRLILDNQTRVTAEQEVRLQNEKRLGRNRFGDSGL